MKIALHSDLHMEFGEEFFTPEPSAYEEADVIVLAGDVHFASESPRWILENFSPMGKPIVYVAGNHEYYNGHWHKSLAYLRETCPSVPNLHFLENRSVTFQGVRFLGCTLWTDYNLRGTPESSKREAESGLNDFIKIGNDKYGLGTLSVEERHIESREWLDSQLTDRSCPTVVVTHHAPHSDSVGNFYVSEELRPAYASDLSGIIYRHAPRIWLHGHIHDPASHTVGKTHIISNPADYPQYRGRFEPKPLIIELV